MVLSAIPAIRIRHLNQAPLRHHGSMVLYWMTAARRTTWNFAFQHALWWGTRLGKPVVVLEALRSGYRYASERLHAFVLDGMMDNQRACHGSSVTYHPYVEAGVDDGKGLLSALSAHACLVVGDDWPGFFFPRMLAAAGRQLSVHLEVVDGNGLLPMRAVDRSYARAVDFRRHLQQTLPGHLESFPAPAPMAGYMMSAKRSGELAGRSSRRPWTIPLAIRRRWPATDLRQLRSHTGLARLPIDHTVKPVPYAGGPVAGALRLSTFLTDELAHYVSRRLDCDHASSRRLSPYLHWGHVGTHQIVAALWHREQWSPERLVGRQGGARGAKSGWWGLSEPAEAFIDQLVTWRELGFNAACHQPRSDTWSSLPRWAIATLQAHAGDPRRPRYTRRRLEDADTADEVWNAAQRELRSDGVIHPYLRMLWSKHLLAWATTPRRALSLMYALNDRWAIDGRDPNSVSGFMWTCGRYDHPWPPQRPVFGSIRFMTSASARRKLRLRDYLTRWSGNKPSCA